jgi:hypothetical protein
LADELAGVVEMEDDVIVQIDLSDTETEDQHLKVIADTIALEWLDWICRTPESAMKELNQHFA